MKEEIKRAQLAAAFSLHIPAHLKQDAMLQNVAEQLAQGGTFSARSVAYIQRYMETATTPMTQEQFNKALGKALGQ
jgi:histone acetyltransferase (RNA polymerase elongator complex component)